MPKILASAPAENLLLMFSFGRNVLGMLFIVDRFLDNYFSLDVCMENGMTKIFFPYFSNLYFSGVLFFVEYIDRVLVVVKVISIVLISTYAFITLEVFLLELYFNRAVYLM